MVLAWLLASTLGGLTFEVENCVGLDTESVLDELELELAPILRSSTRAYGVSLRCADESVELTIQDPITAKRVSRAIVDPGRGDEDRARIIALAAARLFTISWTELALPEAPAAKPAELHVDLQPEERRAAELHVRRQTRPAAVHALGIGAVLGWAGSADGGMQGGLELNYALKVGPRFELVQGLGYYAAGASRGLGSVYAGSVLVSSGGRWVSDSGARDALYVGALAKAGWQDMRGFREDGEAGGHLGNFLVAAQGEGGWRHNRSRPIELGLAGGWSFGGAIGRNPDGQVYFGGPFGALVFRTWWQLRPSQR